MKIAVAYENGEIYGDFAHCPMFALYEYGEYIYECVKTLTDTSALEGHQAMAEKMKELEVDAVLCGEMSGEGKALLLSCGIVPVVGYSGDADTAADLLVTGRLPINPGESAGGCGGGCGGGCSCGGDCGGEEGGCGCSSGDGGCGCGCGSYDGEEAW